MGGHGVGKSATFAGGLSAWLFFEHEGTPIWLLSCFLFFSLASGLYAASGRMSARDERVEAERLALRNVASLFILTFVTVWSGDLKLPASMMVALGIGLGGPRSLREFEKRFFKSIED